MDYIVMRISRHGTLKVGSKLKLTVNTHNNKLGFAPEMVYYLVEDKSDISEIIDVTQCHLKPPKGVALFFPNNPGDMVDGEEWEVVIIKQNLSDQPDMWGHKKFIHQVELKQRITRQTEEKFDEAKSVWVSQVHCGKVLKDTLSIPGKLRKVRYCDPSYPDISYEYKEYLVEVGGKMEVKTRVEIPTSIKNDREEAETRRESLGKLARTLPKLCAANRYPALPDDGKTQKR